MADPSGARSPAQRFVVAVVLMVLGTMMLGGSIPILGLIAWAGGIYFLIAGAIQRGIDDGRRNED